MRYATGDLEIEVRDAIEDDVALLLSFIDQMAQFEQLKVCATEETLRESLFGDRPAASVLLAFVDGKPAAYAVYFFTFATMVGKRGLWLDDLYVDPAFRRKGVGKTLLAYLTDLAIKNQCGRFEWMVLDWNKSAMDFYGAMGATLLDDWRICRIQEDAFAKLAERLVPVDEP